MIGNNEVFPFHITFDRNLAVTELGTSLQKLVPQFRVGSPVDELIVPQGQGGDWSDFEELVASRKTIEAILVESKIPMRCQLVQDGEQLIALGSPRFSSLAELKEHGLTLDDFAPHDTTIELLHLATQFAAANNAKQEGVVSVEESLKHALNAAGDLLIRMTLEGTIIDCKSSREELLPNSPSNLEGTSIFASFPQLADSLGEVLGDIFHVDSCERPIAFSYSVDYGEETMHFDARVTKTPFEEILFLARDVTEQQRSRARLAHRASHDTLTQLPNRTLFTEHVEAALETGELVAVLYVDLDGFKLVNDRHGHQLGDELLIYVANILRSCIGPSDMAARLGGDEFAVLLRGLDSKQAAEVTAARMLEKLTSPARIGHRNMSASASIGIASTYDTRELAKLLQFADVAMYEAKARQKCCCVAFESSMYEELVRRDTLQEQLIAAGEHGQFINYYQPIVEIETGRVVAFETLARWEHPVRGLLMPSDFMQTAEETGAILRLGEMTLENACRDVQTWRFQRDRLPQFHINVSPMQLKKSCITTYVQQSLETFEIAASQLTVEIKEKTLQEHFDIASREIELLANIGANVAIDDFGAGNSSLGFLESLPIRSIKLARSFVGRVGKSEQGDQLVRAVVDLARTFELDIVAVGVETLQQKELLTEFGCGFAQGDYYSVPVPSHGVENIEASRRILTAPAGLNREFTNV